MLKDNWNYHRPNMIDVVHDVSMEPNSALHSTVVSHYHMRVLNATRRRCSHTTDESYVLRLPIISHFSNIRTQAE